MGRGVENTSVTQTYRRRKSGSGAPSRWAIFCNFFAKKSYFNAIESHFARVQSHLKKLDF